MRLRHQRYLTRQQRQHAYSPEQALKLVAKALERGTDIEGLATLRQWHIQGLDSDVLSQIKRGQWVLIKREERRFNWGQFDESVRQQREAYDFVHACPAEPPFNLYFIVTDPDGVPVPDREHIVVTDSGAQHSDNTDANGHTLLITSHACEEATVHFSPQTRLVIA